MSRRMYLKIFAVVCYFGQIVGFYIMQGIRKGHVAVTVVMSESLSISGQVD